MKAIMLAAGRGTRLTGDDDTARPKSLLEFGGRTLLARHVDALGALGVDALTLVVGYRAGEILAELATIGAGDFVRPIENPDFRRGSLVSLWTAREALTAGGPVLFMDADVLYDVALLRRLVETPHATCFLLDRDFEPGEEPVKLCLKSGRPVEFRKAPGEIDYDVIGEWPGFVRLGAGFARRLAAVLQAYMDAGRLDEPYEEAMRAVMLDGAAGQIGVEDITGLPWIEIDFPEDLARATREILPRIDGES